MHTLSNALRLFTASAICLSALVGLTLPSLAQRPVAGSHASTMLNMARQERSIAGQCHLVRECVVWAPPTTPGAFTGACVQYGLRSECGSSL